MKKLSTTLAVLLVISMLVACAPTSTTPEPVKSTDVPADVPVPTVAESQDAGEVIELVLWHQESPPRRVEAFQKIIDRFNAEHPNIQVKQAPQSWAEIYAKLYAAVEAGNPPDILFSIPDMTMAMKLTGAVTPVEDIVNEIDAKYDMLDSQITPYEYDGHIWAVPMWGMTHLLCFNTKQFDEAGISYPLKSWDELLAAGDKLTKDGKFGIGFPASQLMMTDQNVYNYMVTNSCELFDKDGNVAVDSEKCVESFEFYDKLLNDAPPDVVTWNWGDNEMAFLAENISTIQLFPSLAEWMKAEKEGKGPFSCQRVPYPEGGRNGSASYSNGATVFTTDPAKLEAVKTFLTYLQDPAVNGEWLSNWDAGVYLPITKAGMESETFWSNEVVKYYEDIIKLQFAATEDGKLFGFEYAPQPVIARIAGENLLGQMAGKLAVNEMTAQEVVKWAAEKIRTWQVEMQE
jgi:multiple sugar transport system substrate-binding protein